MELPLAWCSSSRGARNACFPMRLPHRRRCLAQLWLVACPTAIPTSRMMYCKSLSSAGSGRNSQEGNWEVDLYTHPATKSQRLTDSQPFVLSSSLRFRHTAGTLLLAYCASQLMFSRRSHNLVSGRLAHSRVFDRMEYSGRAYSMQIPSVRTCFPRRSIRGRVALGCLWRCLCRRS